MAILLGGNHRIEVLNFSLNVKSPTINLNFLRSFRYFKHLKPSLKILVEDTYYTLIWSPILSFKCGFEFRYKLIFKIGGAINAQV